MAEIRPQQGPQENFLASSADIAIYGGSAGGGKTWGLLMEPLRHVGNPNFGAVFFRRSTVQIRNEGGLWDESTSLYPAINGKPKEHVLSWEFPSGASISFAHLEHDKTVYNWQGSQIPLICFDELTHFSAKQFWYMVSRNRSMCGVRPYIRATCNPDADSWVAEFIAWWIDQDTGLPIPDRSGIIRWFVRVGETIVWADQPQDLAKHTMADGDGNQVPIPPKSATFIPASLTDNKALMAADPGYMANLLALPMVERERLLGGNWKIRPSSGMYFKRSWIADFVDAPPNDIRWCRGWDLASTVKEADNDPDWTCGTLMGTTPNNDLYIADHVFDQLSPNGVERLMLSTAEMDREKYGDRLVIDFPQDPGQAGKAQVSSLSKLLAGFDVRSSTETGDKTTRFSPFSAQAEAGNVYVVRGPWNDRWITSLENFPDTGKDDADSTSRAYAQLRLAEERSFGVILSKRRR